MSAFSFLGFTLTFYPKFIVLKHPMKGKGPCTPTNAIVQMETSPPTCFADSSKIWVPAIHTVTERTIRTMGVSLGTRLNRWHSEPDETLLYLQNMDTTGGKEKEYP